MLRLSFFSNQRRVAVRAAIDEMHGRSHERPLLQYDSCDLWDDLPSFLHEYLMYNMKSEFGDLIRIVQ